MMRSLITSLIVCLMAVPLYAQSIHPRGLIRESDMPLLSTKASGLGALLAPIEQEWQVSAAALKPLDPSTSYPFASVLESAAYLYVMTGKASYATKVAEMMRIAAADSSVFHQPEVKGLTRADLLRAFSIAYDLCYHALPERERAHFSSNLLSAALSMMGSMGLEANYAQESNWMGVRYGAVLLAALVADQQPREGRRSSVRDALVWDARERLKDHIEKNINPDGWSAESTGYHFYNWSFIAPALIAYEHYTGKERTALDQLAKHAKNSFRACATAQVPIRVGNRKGVKADLSDDNISIDPNLFWYGQELCPEDQLPMIRWTALQLEHKHTARSLFLKLAYDKEAVKPTAPGSAWLNFTDHSQGVSVYRNRFANEKDIVATFTATAKRVRAHQGGDNLTFRIIGLDNVWAIGAGRTDLKAGQTNLFPEDTVPLKARYIGGTRGKILDHATGPDGSGYVVATGNCMGVTDHRRRFAASFDPAAGAEAVFVVIDSSANGRTWRLNTPSFNKVKKLHDGFLIEAPDGSSMKATVMNVSKVDVRISEVPYDGVTVQNAIGVPFKDTVSRVNTAIDLSCDKHIMVVLTLAKPGAKHPPLKYVNGELYSANNKINFSK